jgi:hypothetical protein
MTSKTLGWVLAALAGAQAIAGASDLADLLTPATARWVQLVVGAVGIGVGVYAGNQAVMPGDVRAYDPPPVKR